MLYICNMHSEGKNEFSYDVLDTDDMHVENCKLIDLLNAQKCGLEIKNLGWDLQTHEKAILNNNAKLVNEDYSASVGVGGCLMTFHIKHLLWVLNSNSVYTDELLFYSIIDARVFERVIIWYAGFYFDILTNRRDGSLSINGERVHFSSVYNIQDFSMLSSLGIYEDGMLRFKLSDLAMRRCLNFTFNKSGICSVKLGRNVRKFTGVPMSYATAKRKLLTI